MARINRRGKSIPFHKSLRLERLEQRRLLVADVDLEIIVDGADATSPPGPSVEIGKELKFVHEVSNPGTEPLDSIEIVDDRGTSDPSDDHRPEPLTVDSPVVGTLEASFADWEVARLLRHPTEPLIYASVRNHNSVAVINTNTLETEEMIFTGSQPWQMAITPDGSKLYVVNGYTQLLSVVDTATNTKVNDLVLPDYVLDVEVAADGQLFLLHSDWVKKLDPTTGEVGPDLIGRSYASPGDLRLNAAKDRLYLASTSGSPNPLYEFDLTVDPPALLFNSRNLEYYGNGQDIDLSNDSEHIVFSAGLPGRIAVYRTSDMAIVGTFNTGSSGAVTYAPDDSVVYSAHDYYEIELYDTQTFLPLVTINTGIRTKPIDMMVDQSGSHLFAAIDDELRVFATGRGLDVNVGDVNANQWLDPGETWQYSADLPAEAGGQAIAATVNAVSEDSQTVTASASANYVGAYGVRIESTVNGNSGRADIEAGSEIQFDYEVTNLGQFPIGDVELIDDNGTPSLVDDFAPELISGDINANELLDPAETWIFRSTQSARSGEYSSIATVTGTPHDNGPLNGIEATATATASYFGAVTSVNVELRTNGQSADLPAGVRVDIDDPITWTYEVTNDGNVPLANVQVSDSNGTTAVGDDFTPAATIGAGLQGALLQTFPSFSSINFVPHPTLPRVYVALEALNSVAVIDTETLELVDQIFVGSNPRSMVFGNDGHTLYISNNTTNFITIVDTTTHTVSGQLFAPDFVRSLGLAADGQLYAMTKDWLGKIDPLTGTIGPNLAVRSQLPSLYGIMHVDLAHDRLYTVPLAGSDTRLRQFDIASDPEQIIQLHETPSTGSGGNDFALSNNGELAAFARGSPYYVSLYLTSHMIEIGTFQTGSYPRVVTFSSDDQLAYAVHTSGEIDIFSTQNFLHQGMIATQGEARDLWAESSGKHLFASFDDEIRVYHTGRFSPDFNVGDLNHNDLLDPGETWEYTAEGIATAGLYATKATVTAETLEGTPVSDSDPSHYIGGLAVAVDALLNGVDTSPGNVPLLDARLDSEWSFVVTNPGHVPLANVSVRDNRVSANSGDDIVAEYIRGDLNGNDLLDPGESWLFSTDAPPVPGNHVTSGTVSAAPVDQFDRPIVSEQIEATDVNHYTALNPDLEIELFANGNPADTPTGPLVPTGEQVHWEYRLRNAGDVSLGEIHLTDADGTESPSDDFAPAAVLNPLGTFGALQGELGVTGTNDFVWDLVEHATEPFAYGISTESRLMIVNTNTFTTEHDIPLAGYPLGIALDESAGRLYVAISDTNELFIWDTVNQQPLAPLELPSNPRDIAVGPNGELFTVFPGQVVELDPVTGDIVGDPLAGASVVRNGGGITTSPSKDRLFFASYHVSPTYLYQYDLTTDPPQLVTFRHETGVGLDLSISHDSSFLSYPTNSAEHDSQTAILDATTLDVLGYLATEEPAAEIAFSPDDTRAYTVHESGTIQVWDTATFELLGEISTQGESYGLWVGSDDLRLLSSFRGQFRSYSTGNDGLSINTGDQNRNGQLDPGESWWYESFGVSQSGQFATEASATTTPLGTNAEPLENFDEENATDLGHYFGIAPDGATVIARNLFYNDSMFDGNNPDINAADDNAIAAVEPLLPGGTIGPANYSSFMQGLNGVMIDVANLAADTLDPAVDFEFRVGNGGDSSTWPLAPAPSDIAIRSGAGAGGTDRIVLTWDNNAIADTWLLVVLKATEDTGLGNEDAFHFAHVTADITGDGLVNASDFQSARLNSKSSLNPAKPGDPYDVNRDARVDAADLVMIRDRVTTIGKALGKVQFNDSIPRSKAANSLVAPFSYEAIDSNASIRRVEQRSGAKKLLLEEPTTFNDTHHAELLTLIANDMGSIGLTNTVAESASAAQDRANDELLDKLFQELGE